MPLPLLHTGTGFTRHCCCWSPCRFGCWFWMCRSDSSGDSGSGLIFTYRSEQTNQFGSGAGAGIRARAGRVYRRLGYLLYDAGFVAGAGRSLTTTWVPVSGPLSKYLSQPVLRGVLRNFISYI